MDAAATVASVRATQSFLSLISAIQMAGIGLYPQTALYNGDEFDYIVVGAGSAGCVIANRLSEDHNETVLLVEAGGDPPIYSFFPGLMGYLKESEVDWKTTSVKDKNLQKCHKHHIADMTHGKMLGGSSGINYLAYTRGDPHDFDRWANIVGDESWNYKNVLPYFIKSENLKDPEILKSPNKIFHGTDGYLDVTRQDFGVTHKYLNAFEQLGHKIVIDTNGNYTLGYNQPSYTLANGQRQSTANSFLKPAKSRANLYIAKNTFATKIIFDKFNNAVLSCKSKTL